MQYYCPRCEVETAEENCSDCLGETVPVGSRTTGPVEPTPVPSAADPPPASDPWTRADADWHDDGPASRAGADKTVAGSAGPRPAVAGPTAKRASDGDGGHDVLLKEFERSRTATL